MGTTRRKLIVLAGGALTLAGCGGGAHPPSNASTDADPHCNPVCEVVAYDKRIPLTPQENATFTAVAHPQTGGPASVHIDVENGKLKFSNQPAAGKAEETVSLTRPGAGSAGESLTVHVTPAARELMQQKASAR